MSLAGFERAWRCGAAVQAVREIQASGEFDRRRQVAWLKSVARTPSLPATAPERAWLSARLGREVQALPPEDGVYCVSFDAGPPPLGSVQRLSLLTRGGSWLEPFSAGCSRGAAAAWIVERTGLVDLPFVYAFEPQPIGICTGSVIPTSGESAGLPAALVFAWTLLNKPGLRVVATGWISGEGTVGRVDGLRAKALSVVREAPFLDLMLIPADQMSEIPVEVLRHIRVEPVSTVGRAIEAVFGPVGPRNVPSIDPTEAARRAARHESRKEHGIALALARQIKAALRRAPRSEVDSIEPRVKAEIIEGINLTHLGHAAAARECFAAVDRLLDAAPGAVAETIGTDSFAASLAAKRASASIDLLDYDQAIAICTASFGRPRLEVEARLELLGSLGRALAAKGELDAADRILDQQMRVFLPASLRHQECQRLCNRLDVLFRRSARGEAVHTGIVDALEVARRANSELPEGAARSQNNLYLDLWTVRLHALRGEHLQARRLAERRRGAEFPALYFQRFLGEALAVAGLTDEAIRTLDAVEAHIGTDVGPFARIILSTATAAAARMRLARREAGWQPAARRFLKQLKAWNPRFIEVPHGRSTAEWDHALGSALRRLPY